MGQKPPRGSPSQRPLPRSSRAPLNGAADACAIEAAKRAEVPDACSARTLLQDELHVSILRRLVAIQRDVFTTCARDSVYARVGRDEGPQH
eukprot:7532669-Pyramimonas_sp.AAC.1